MEYMQVRINLELSIENSGQINLFVSDSTTKV